MENIRNKFRSLDFFGYTPTFRIDGQDKLKSFISGFFTFIFLVFAVTYLIYSINNYSQNINNVATSRSITRTASSYRVSTTDIYYGIGLVDKNENPLNFSDFSFLKIKAFYNHLNKTDAIFTSTSFNLSICKTNLFIPNNDFMSLDSASQEFISSRIPFYYCPLDNSSFYLAPNDYTSDSYSIQFSIDLVDNYNVTQALEVISNLQPSLSFLYQIYIIDTNNKSKPYTQTIAEVKNEIGYYFSKSFEMIINPTNILDDINPLGSGEYTSLNVSAYSTLKDGTVFTTYRDSDYFRYFNQRDAVSSSNNNLMTIYIKLGILANTTLRTYRKFNDFVASVSSLISNLLLAFGLFLTRINSIKGVNNMIRSLFNIEYITHIHEFRTKFKNISDNFVVRNHENQSILKKKKNNKYQKKRILSQTQEPKTQDKIISDDMENFGEFNQNYGFHQRSKEKKKSTIIQKSVSMKIDNKLYDILSDNVKFGFCDYIKMKYFCGKSKRVNELFENAIYNIQKLMDINQYISFKLDMDMIKEVVLDRYQKSAFEIMSSMLNFNRLFEYEKPTTKFKLDMNLENVNDVIYPIKKIYERRNDMDEKIINFFKNTLDSAK